MTVPVDQCVTEHTACGGQAGRSEPAGDEFSVPGCHQVEEDGGSLIVVLCRHFQAAREQQEGLFINYGPSLPEWVSLFLSLWSKLI